MRKKSELRAYQQKVVTDLYNSTAILAVLKMGAGKTISTLTALTELIDDKVIRHGLVLAPKRVAQMVWPAEVKNWAHTAKLSWAVLNGGPMRRYTTLLRADERQLTICGIDNAQWLCEELEKLPDDDPLFDLLILDETSRLKDPKSKRGKALFKIAHRFKNRWGLTGTPRPNSSLDLFNPMRIITNGAIWGRSFYAWQREHFYPTDFQGYDWAAKPGTEEMITRTMAPYSTILREEDMPELPELSILVDEVDLPDDARHEYRRMERHLFAQIKDEDIVAASRAIATGKLAQIANGFIYGEGGNLDVSRIHVEKHDWIKELVRDLNGEPLVIVYEYREDIVMLRSLFGEDMPYLGAGTTDTRAEHFVTEWNAGRLPILAIHPASAGHGLNLQEGGSRMAWLAPTWSAEMWDQTIARLHRPGQTGHVMVHVCAARFTVDELKRSRVIGKLSSQAAFERYLAHAASQAVAA